MPKLTPIDSTDARSVLTLLLEARITKTQARALLRPCKAAELREAAIAMIGTPECADDNDNQPELDNE